MRALLALLLVAFGGAALAQPTESEVKAAFLFKFLSFVEWPPGALPPRAPLVIGVQGADEVAAALEEIVPARQAQDRPVVLRRVRPGESTAGLHVLFVGRREAPRLRELARAAPGQPTLLVAEWEGALAEGAVVNFLVAQSRVRFEVALDAAERRALRVSPRMLAVAQAVQRERP